MSAPALLESLSNAISMQEAAKLLPTKPSIAQLHRWCESGFDLNRGHGSPHVIHLQSWWFGRKRVTTRDALERFVQAMNRAPAAVDKSQPAKRSRRGRRPRNTAGSRAGWQLKALNY